MKKISVGFIVSLGAFALSAAWLIAAGNINVNGAEGLTSKSFPILISGLMLLFSAITSIEEFLAMRNGKTEGINLSWPDVLRVVGLIAVMVIYAFVMPHIGFVFSTILLLLAAMLIYGHKNKLTVVLVSILLPIALKLLFQYVLKVALP